MKKLTCFARPPKFWTRMILMLAGVTLQGMGLSVLRALDLGTDPCSCLTQGVCNIIHLSFGTTQVLCHLITFLIVIFTDMSYIGFGTIGNMVFLGYISDFFKWIWSLILPENFFLSNRYIILIPALIVFIVGAATYMCAGLGSSPYDAVPFIISKKLPKINFRIIRMIWDGSFAVIGFVLLLSFDPAFREVVLHGKFGEFLLHGSFGVVTLAVVLFLGPVVGLVQKLIQKLFRVDPV